MTANASPLVQTPPNSAQGSGAARADAGQSSSADTAAAFQSVLQGMKHGKVPVEGPGQNGRGQGEPQQEQRSQGQEEGPNDPGPKQTGETGPRGTGAIAFSTSNLVNALREVSQNVMSRFSGPEGAEGGSGEETQPGLQGQLAQTSVGVQTATALASGTVVSTKSGQASAKSGQASAGPQLGNAPAPRGDAPDMMVREGAARDGQARTGTASLFAQFGVEPEQVSDPLTGAGGRRSLLPEEAAGSVKILRQETHFAPNMRLSPAQQVGEQVVSAIKSLASDQTVQGQGGVTHRAEGPVLKTLDIQLTPHELGTVKVSLRMVGESVEVTLRASQPQTAELLKQDRQLLDQMLKTTGVKADAVTIQTADDRVAVQAGSSAGGNAPMNQNNSGNAGFGEGQPQNGGNGQPGNREGRPGQEAREETFTGSQAARGEGHEGDTGSRLSDGIYL